MRPWPCRPARQDSANFAGRGRDLRLRLIWMSRVVPQFGGRGGGEGVAFSGLFGKKVCWVSDGEDETS
jgi:hypothetical protein